MNRSITENVSLSVQKISQVRVKISHDTLQLLGHNDWQNHQEGKFFSTNDSVRGGERLGIYNIRNVLKSDIYNFFLFNGFVQNANKVNDEVRS